MSDKTTGLIHHPYTPPAGFDAPQPGVHKASTVIFPSVAAMRSREWKDKTGYTYGLHGTPTSFTRPSPLNSRSWPAHELPAGRAAGHARGGAPVPAGAQRVGGHSHGVAVAAHKWRRGIDSRQRLRSQQGPGRGGAQGLGHLPPVLRSPGFAGSGASHRPEDAPCLAGSGRFRDAGVSRPGPAGAGLSRCRGTVRAGQHLGGRAGV